MFSPSQIRLLKIAVIGMGVILLLGFVLVIGRIIYLVNRAPQADAPAAATGASGRAAPLALPAGAVVRHLAISGQRLAVHYEGPTGAGLRVLDLGTGVWSSPIPIVVETAPSGQRP